MKDLTRSEAAEHIIAEVETLAGDYHPNLMGVRSISVTAPNGKKAKVVVVSEDTWNSFNEVLSAAGWSFEDYYVS